MTPNFCTSFCQLGGATGVPLTGLNFADMEFASECYCDFNIEGTATQADDTECNIPCGGDSTFICGGAGRISIYQDLGHGSVLPINKVKVGKFSRVDGNRRTLTERFDIPDGVTIETCTKTCQIAGFNITGLEFGQECWCGSSFLVANTTLLWATACKPATRLTISNFVVPRTILFSAEYNRVFFLKFDTHRPIHSLLQQSSMYFIAFATSFILASLPNVLSSPFVSSELSKRSAAHGPAAGWTYVGCYTDIASSRTLLETSTINAQMTPYMCTTFCQGANSSALTVCDFNIQGTARKVNDTECNYGCGGDTSYICGGAGYVSIYQDKGHKGVLPTNKAKVGNWTFDGCYKDNVNVTKVTKRTLSQRFEISAGVTVERCTSQCAAKGFHISGLEFGQECWCGSSFLVANATAALSDCSEACAADHTELCGAANRLSVYKNGTSKS
ncbi:WSC domain-containing protein [Flammula alnicola]|nr:WSC domain-containing protein [Flammula alnicola]